MAGRSACPRQPGRGSIARPALTRTQMLRAAQTSAVVQREPRPESRREPVPRTSGATFARQALSRPCPRKLDFAKPPMTKAMQMRQKAAAEKIKAYEAQQKAKADAAARRTRRSAPAATCPRPKSAQAPRRSDQESLRVLQASINRGHDASMRQPPNLAVEAAISKGHVTTARGPRPKRSMPRSSGCPKPMATGTPFPEDTRELAKSMNADVVQATPIGEGPVNKIIIDPGAVRPDRSTIVVLPTEASSGGGSDIANKSIQAISETLDEQDAVESAAVQGKLEELQNARREFVIAVANVSGNAVNLHEESCDSILNIDDMDEMEYLPMPPLPTRERTIVRVPDISHVMFQIDYARDHPDVEAARSFSRKTQKTLDHYAQQKRMEDAFERAQRDQIQDFDLEVPFEQEIQEGDISWEEDDQGTLFPCPSRVKASMRIPQRPPDAPPIQGGNIDDLERFFDLDNYPPEPKPPGAPPGRENLNPDLWGLEDPWYFEKSYDPPPLMRFDSSC